MLASARRQNAKQVRVAGMAAREAQRTSEPFGIAQVVATYQAASATLALQSIPETLAEQGVQAPPQGAVMLSSLLTGVNAVASMLQEIDAPWQLDRLVKTLVSDAARTATTVDMASRPAITGHVRYLDPPSCPRCAILAGRVYRISTGFLRHPGCDCVMVETTDEVAPNLVTNPRDAYEQGHIRGLSQADIDAIELGADIGQVVNVRRKAAGLTVSGSVLERRGRPTPAGILRMASDRDEAIALLQRFNYLTS